MNFGRWLYIGVPVSIEKQQKLINEIYPCAAILNDDGEPHHNQLLVETDLLCSDEEEEVEFEDLLFEVIEILQLEELIKGWNLFLNSPHEHKSLLGLWEIYFHNHIDHVPAFALENVADGLPSFDAFELVDEIHTDLHVEGEIVLESGVMRVQF